MLLTPEEREKFAAYLERSAAADAQMLAAVSEQPEWWMVVEKKKREMEACITVAEMLRKTTDIE